MLADQGICVADSYDEADVIVAEPRDVTYTSVISSKPTVWLLSHDEDVQRVISPKDAGWAVLWLNASADMLAAAVRAVATGLVALSPDLYARLPPPPRAQLSEAVVELSSRERQVLELVSLGLTSKAIAERLGVAESTIKFHLSNAYAKLGAESRVEAVRKATQQGLIAL